MTEQPEHHRPIVSFQPRGGRMNDVQKRAWEAYADEWLVERDAFGPIPEPGTPPDPAKPWWRPGINQIALFGRVAPLVIEIGPGMGDATAAMAKARPDINILAIEVYTRATLTPLEFKEKCGAIVVWTAVRGR